MLFADEVNMAYNALGSGFASHCTRSAPVSNEHKR